jgi:ATP-dependent protease Clp ATPase subunit
MSTADIIPFAKPKTEPILRICSFCRKREDQVRKLFSNGHEGTPQLKCICDECVSVAAARIKQTLKQREEAPTA